jgi:hypothetical protein
VEKARQHSALDRETLAIGIIRLTGLACALGGLLLQFVFGSPSLLAGISLLFLSKATVSAWILVRPNLFAESNRAVELAVCVIATIAAFGSAWVAWEYWQ